MGLPDKKYNVLPVITKKEDAFSFKDFNLNNEIDNLTQRMSDDVFIMGRVAIKGQITIFYASPNTGKTLLMIALIKEAINDHRINGEDVIYINADDNLRGFTTKAEILKASGVINIAPGEGGFKISSFEPMILSMVERGDAKDKIIIVDTLKKFTDLMNKSATGEFMEVMRGFTLAGGSLVFLAHTNKHTDDNDKPVFQGTSDSLDDCDCAYTIQVTSSMTEVLSDHKFETKSVHFNNIKSRGDNELKVDYEYTKTEGASYSNMVASVKVIDDIEAQERTERITNEKQKLFDKEYIEKVKSSIADGVNGKTELITILQNMKEGLSKIKARQLIDRYDGKVWIGVQEGVKFSYSILEAYKN